MLLLTFGNNIVCIFNIVLWTTMFTCTLFFFNLSILVLQISNIQWKSRKILFCFYDKINKKQHYFTKHNRTRILQSQNSYMQTHWIKKCYYIIKHSWKNAVQYVHDIMFACDSFITARRPLLHAHFGNVSDKNIWSLHGHKVFTASFNSCWKRLVESYF